MKTKQKNEPEIRICKNKKCQRILPEGYRHKYCEACRTEFAEKLKDGGKTALKGLGAVASLAVVVLTAGKINPKD